MEGEKKCIFNHNILFFEYCGATALEKKDGGEKMKYEEMGSRNHNISLSYYCVELLQFI